MSKTVLLQTIEYDLSKLFEYQNSSISSYSLIA